MTVRFTPAAAREIQEARDWYEAKRYGLGEDFEGPVGAAAAAVQRNPMLSPRVGGVARRREIRLKKIDRFPYVLFYEILDQEIVVVAVAHTSRRPGYWRRRSS